MLENNEIPFREAMVFGSRLMEKNGIEHAIPIAVLDPKVDLIVSTYDSTGTGNNKYFEEHGIKISQDIATLVLLSYWFQQVTRQY